MARLAGTSKGVWHLTEESVKAQRQTAAGGAKLCCHGPSDTESQQKPKRTLISAAIFDLEGVLMDSEREVSYGPLRYDDNNEPSSVRAIIYIYVVLC